MDLGLIDKKFTEFNEIRKGASNTSTVDRAKIRRAELETALYQLIYEYEEETLLEVKEVTAYRPTGLSGTGRIKSIGVLVELPRNSMSREYDEARLQECKRMRDKSRIAEEEGG